jgi:DNA-binding transcriptional MerR regulator
MWSLVLIGGWFLVPIQVSACFEVLLSPIRPISPLLALGPLTRPGAAPKLGEHPRNYGVVMSEEGFRVPDVCRIVGISYRQLDYWARTDLVTPSIRDARGSGTQRLYSFQDLVSLKVIKNLLDTGISLQRVRKAVEYLQEMDRPTHGVTLMSDGKGVYEAHSPEAVVDLLNKGQGVFAIALDKVWDDLEGTLATRKAGRAATGGA